MISVSRTWKRKVCQLTIIVEGFIILDVQNFNCIFSSQPSQILHGKKILQKITRSHSRFRHPRMPREENEDLIASHSLSLCDVITPLIEKGSSKPLAENGCYLVWSFENKYHALSVQVGLCHWSFFHDLLWKEEICPASWIWRGLPLPANKSNSFLLSGKLFAHHFSFS